MLHNEGTFKTYDGLDLYQQYWKGEGSIKGIIAVVHGYAEHGARYEYVAERLTSHGYVVCTYDLRGHGRSEGKKAFIHSFDDYLYDLQCFLELVNDRSHGIPLFLLGHSMGGTISTLYVLRNNPDISGLILSAPLLMVKDRLLPVKLMIAKTIDLLSPSMPLIKKLDARLMSTDAMSVAAYESDPLIYHGNMNARMALEINRALRLIDNDMEALECPLLIMHGTNDSISCIEGSKKIHSHASSADKTIKLYDGLFHEIFNEVKKDMVIADMTAWLDHHTDSQ